MFKYIKKEAVTPSLEIIQLGVHKKKKGQSEDIMET